MSEIKALRTFVGAAKKAAAKTATQPSTQQAMSKLAKWGVPAAVVTAGAYTIPTAAGAGIENGFGIDPNNLGKSTAKISGWIIFLIVAAIAVLYFMPKLKKMRK